jgi:hypothetical protein
MSPEIKKNPALSEGSKHVWRMIHFSRYLPDDLKNVVNPVIQRNAYFAHPENILVAMLSDDRKHIRELAVRRTLKIREEQPDDNPTPRHQRLFKIPKLNFAADDYSELIFWPECNVSEPPVTKALSTVVLKEYIDRTKEHDPGFLDLPNLPCHTQAVERCVKLVTEAATAVCGAEARDGFIKAKIKSRRRMPFFNTKSDYKL